LKAASGESSNDITHHNTTGYFSCFMIIIYKNLFVSFKKSYIIRVLTKKWKTIENFFFKILHIHNTLIKITILTLCTNNKVQRNKNMHSNDLFHCQSVLHHFNLLFHSGKLLVPLFIMVNKLSSRAKYILINKESLFYFNIKRNITCGCHQPQNIPPP